MAIRGDGCPTWMCAPDAAPGTTPQEAMKGMPAVRRCSMSAPPEWRQHRERPGRRRLGDRVVDGVDLPPGAVHLLLRRGESELGLLELTLRDDAAAVEVAPEVALLQRLGQMSLVDSQELLEARPIFLERDHH